MSTLSELYQVLVNEGQLNSRERFANFHADMIFIGPKDLALSILNYAPAENDEPEFAEAIANTVSSARRYGKWVARLSNNGLSSKEHLKTFDALAMSYHVRAVQNWYTAELQIARS